ncbi:F-box protein [Coxiella burnetii]|nr:F-box protein [Coxiella burnetii]POZ68210.1 hypothetical protein CbuRSA514_10775 [Coxiella burnetii]
MRKSSAKTNEDVSPSERDHLSELNPDTLKKIIHNLSARDSYSLSLSNKSLRNKVGAEFEHRAKTLN